MDFEVALEHLLALAALGERGGELRRHRVERLGEGCRDEAEVLVVGGDEVERSLGRQTGGESENCHEKRFCAREGALRQAPSSVIVLIGGHKLSRIFGMPFSAVYPLYIAKLERKGRTRAELDEVIEWLTGFDEAGLQKHLDANTTFTDFFADARLNPNADLITGVICGVRVEQIEDPLMQKVRYLDKLVDELYKGKKMESVLRARKLDAEPVG